MAGGYQEKYEQLLEEKQKVELEFGLARRRFKELYVGCENQLNNEKENSRQLENQVKELTRQIDAFKGENEGIRIAAKMSEEAKQEEFANLRMKHEEEIATYQHLWREDHGEKQNRMKIKHDEEIKDLNDHIKKLEQKLKQMEEGNTTVNRGVAGGGTADGSIVSLMSNAFTLRKPAHSSTTQAANSSFSLESSQQQVQQNIDAWKSVVEPLEAEIESLRKQLAESHSSKPPGFTPKKSDKEYMLNEELKEAQKYFESEKSARTDLEMYVAVLNTQKTVLQEDSDKLKRELHNVCRLFEQEKMNHNELKQTWKLANEQFLTQQKKLISELELTKKILTPSQVEQLSTSKCSDCPPHAIKTVAEHPYQVTTKTPNEDSPHSTDNLIDFDGESGKTEGGKSPMAEVSGKELPVAIQKGTSNLKEEIFSTFFPAAYQAQQFSEMLSGESNIKEQPLILSSSSDSEEDDLEQAIRIQNMNKYADGRQDNSSTQSNNVALLEDFDSESVVHSVPTDPNTINKTGNEVFSTAEKSILSDASITSNNMDTIQETKSETNSANADDSIWNNVSVDYSHTCMMCQNYERQLQTLQKDYMATKEREQAQVDAVKFIESQLNLEKEHAASLEKSIETISSDNRTQVCIYEKNQQEVDRQVQNLQAEFADFQVNILKSMKSLMGEESS